MADLAEILARYPGAETFRYGDSETLNAEILELVRSGRKTMTCGVLPEFEASGEALPDVGRVDISLDWAGKPAVAVRTVSIEPVRFCDVQEHHIPAQGEFRDLAHWCAGYEAYLTRTGYFHPEVEMFIETFELVEDFG